MEFSRTVKLCNNLCTMGESAGFDYETWAIAQELVQNQLLQNMGFFLSIFCGPKVILCTFLPFYFPGGKCNPPRNCQSVVSLDMLDSNMGL
jgi:hypothetical protein